jgi:hypothetical protein
MRKLLIGLTVLSAMILLSLGGAGAGADGENGDDGWLLGGSARLAQDPDNPANDVIKISTVGGSFGTVSRTVNTKVDRLDNMLEFKSWFELGKTCFGGSPRFQLAIDRDGDGDSDGNAFGYYGPSPSFTGCPPQNWMYEDLTGAGDALVTGGPLAPSLNPTRPTPNEELEWDLTQFGGLFYNTWSQVEAFFAAQPSHQVCTVALVDDSFGAPGMSGIAYYDIISGGRATFEDRDDIAGRGFARGCGRGDDDDDGDDDGDNDHDGDDDRFDDDRRARWDDD